jgi:hypothetical protein
MRQKSVIGLLLLTLFIVGSCARKRIEGKWKIKSMVVQKNKPFDKKNLLVFDPEGFIKYNNNKAASGEWVMNSSNSTITISLYGKSIQKDIEIEGEYDFSGNEFIVTSKENSKVLLELEKIEDNER